jgi:hypothetical protein
MSGKKDRPVEGDKKGASQDSRPLEADVADVPKAKKPQGRVTPKKARSRERKKRNVGPFE